jgi:formamidopyrimidine-DNA glycosylase
MPELPEVEIVKRSLFKMINKAKIIGIKVNNKNLRYKIPHTFAKDLIGEKILKITRRSKYLIIHLINKVLLVHLGMTGKFFVKSFKDNTTFKTSFYYDLKISTKHNHIYFFFNNNLTLIYNDVRKFGFLKIYEKKKLNKIKFLSKLGLEPFSKKVNFKYFKSFIINKRKNIKNLLMDQTFICGLGNIYVNECLFISRIHPLRECNSLKKKEISNLINNIKKILKTSILEGGSSIRDFKNMFGKKGNYQQFFHVYGRENENCSRISCTNKIEKKLISGRSTFYCNNCQN